MGTARLLATCITLFASTMVVPALAQEPDVPGRVGRIAHIEGNVSLYQDSETGWEKGYVNSPFTSENSVWTDLQSRAELRVAGTAIRLDETSQIDLVRLDDNEFEAFVPRGTVAVRVRHFDKGDSWQFDTPYARFSLRANGRYRIDVDPDRQEARITAFSGEAQVGSDSGRVVAKAGDTVRVFGGESSSYVVERALADPFDKWADSRDSAWVETNTVKYVSPEMTGYEDLDRNGSWAQEPDYGALWYPSTVAASWAPYRYGHWGYVRPWGWTWVDDSPWGYAPFHYGRWVNVRNRWAWSPGTRAPRPVWAPALVAWVGGAGFSVGVGGSPSVGWYPLSPWDRYQPWYRASNTYVTRVNVVVINNAPRGNQAEWRSYTRDHGATFVNRDVVVDRRPVQQAIVQVKPEVIRQAQVTTPAVALPPRQEVMERHNASVRLAAQQAAQTNNRPALPPPTPKPEFKPRPVVATQTPQPAKAAPPPAVRVSPPPATREAQRPATTPPATGRPATTSPATTPPVATGRPAAPPPPPATGRPTPPAPPPREPAPTARETPPATARPAPPARETPPPTARETPAPAARPAPPATPREAPPAPNREAQRTEEQKAAQASQERMRQQQQQQQQQQRAEEQKAAQAAQERARQQQQQQQTRAEEQKAAQAARQQQQQQQQQRAEEQKAAAAARQQQQQQQQARQPQPQPEKAAPARKEPPPKEKSEKEKEDEKKKEGGR